MRSSYSVQATPQFRVLSEDQIKDIHNATLLVLERTGVKVYSEEGCNLLREAGAAVTEEGLVRIPSALAEWALRTAPSRITLYDRLGNPAMLLEEGNVYFGPGPSTPYTLCAETGERRPVTRQDVVNTSKAVDFLENIDYAMSLAVVSDCPRQIADVVEFEAMLKNTTKPILGWGFDVAGYEDILDMATAVAGSLTELQMKPFFFTLAEPTSPLLHSRESVAKILFMAERNLPIVYAPGSQSGAASPITAAANLVLKNAEVLSGLVLVQLKKQGCSFVYGAGFNPMDMKTTVVAYGSPEGMLRVAAMCDIARYYGLPTWGFAGCSDSKKMDQQAALEAALQIFSVSLAGGNLVHDVGYLESGMTGSIEMMVLCDEIIGMVKAFMRGIEINEETLALDVIHKVGPGGFYLTENHTLNHSGKAGCPLSWTEAGTQPGPMPEANRWKTGSEKRRNTSSGTIIRFL